jgi:hypothetical protein
MELDRPLKTDVPDPGSVIEEAGGGLPMEVEPATFAVVLEGHADE